MSIRTSDLGSSICLRVSSFTFQSWRFTTTLTFGEKTLIFSNRKGSQKESLKLQTTTQPRSCPSGWDPTSVQASTSPQMRLR
ncbi:unnamed protein product [Linum tenue]|uniref:Uncharacterized protein n=1 Tax=Linum tenue TaxID=586396 RepID=A0AAV0NX69_9ROSI|nr:unnamed protein product [Linum tenue]